MDFVTLAVEGDPRRLMRHLDQMLGDDDEFDPTNNGSPASTIYHSVAEEEAASLSASAQRPVLSKTSEAELYLLATNFLLYVALVIVTTIVAKIYFPESVERDTSTLQPPSYSYRVSTAQKSLESEDFYGSDVEEDDKDEDDDDDDNEELSSGSEQDAYFDHPRDDFLASSGQGDYFQRSSNFLEFNQESLSKAQVVKRLVFCSLMLNITFVMWGALQERMLTRRYPRYTGEYFTYSYALVFTNRFWTLIMSAGLMLYLKPRASRSTVIYEYSFPSISNMLSSWCQYEALRYVSFPATTLFKSFKLAPVMLMGKVLGNKSCKYNYLSPCLVKVHFNMNDSPHHYVSAAQTPNMTTLSL